MNLRNLFARWVCVCVEVLLLISLHFYLAKIAIFRLLKLTPIYDPLALLCVP